MSTHSASTDTHLDAGQPVAWRGAGARAPTRGRWRERVASAAQWAEGAWRWTQLTHAAGAKHPLQTWLVREPRRAGGLVVVFAAVAAVAMLTDTEILRTGHCLPLVPKGHFPLLFGGLVATAIAVRRAPDRLRRPLLLGTSLSAAAYFSVPFTALSLTYFTILYGVLAAARVPRSAKVAFVALTLAENVVAFASFFPRVAAGRHDAAFFLYAFAFQYTFRLAYLLHELHVSKFARPPCYVDLLIYFFFFPFFIVLPGSFMIPRFDRFVANLDKPMPDGDVSAVRHALAGVIACVSFLALRRVCDPVSAGTQAAQEGRFVIAFLWDVARSSAWLVLQYVGVAYVCTAMLHALGIAAKPPIDHALGSESLLDWWRRWNVQLRDFLVDVFFYPVVLKVKRTYLGITLGCAGVFFVGSVAAHAFLYVFQFGGYQGAQLGALLGEGSATFAVVAACLCLERGRKRQPRRPLRLSDPTVPLLAWARARALMGLRIGLTMASVFLTTGSARQLGHVVMFALRNYV